MKRRPLEINVNVTVTPSITEVPSNPHDMHSERWYIHERLCTVGNPYDAEGRPYAMMLSDPAVVGIIEEVLLALHPRKAAVV